MTDRPQSVKCEIENKTDQFLEYLEVEKGCSPLTIRNYRHYLYRFCGYLKREKIRRNLSDINNEVVHSYRIFLSRFKDPRGNFLSRKTQGYHAIALRSFLKWCIKNDLKVMAPEKIELPKISERQIKFLTGEQVDRLLNAPSLSSINGKRDKAILEVLYSTGLRVSELVGLNRDKLDFKTREVGIVGKGGRARVVFLSLRACDWVKNYLGFRKDNHKPLFIRHKGKEDSTDKGENMRLTARSVQRMIKKYSRKISLPVDVSTHTIRHSFATDLLIAGADIRSVQEMLGHKNIQTTQVYTHVTHKHLKEIHETYHSKSKGLN